MSSRPNTAEDKTFVTLVPNPQVPKPQRTPLAARRPKTHHEKEIRLFFLFFSIVEEKRERNLKDIDNKKRVECAAFFSRGR